MVDKVAGQSNNKRNWGGKREGAGGKPQTLTAHQVQLMLKKAKEWAKKTGKDIDDILLSIIYEEGNKRDTLAAIKLWKEYTMAKLAEGGEADKNVGPAVYLPEQRPELKIVEGDKK